MSVHFCARLARPGEVVSHPQLEPEVKRQILASWASDAWTVDSQPSLRNPPELSGPVAVDEILGALKALDSAGGANATRTIAGP